MSKIVGILRYHPDPKKSPSQVDAELERLNLAVEEAARKVVADAVVAVVIAQTEDERNAKLAAAVTEHAAPTTKRRGR